MTVYILPCGVSIRDGLERDSGSPGAIADPQDLLDKHIPWAKRIRRSSDAGDGALYDNDMRTAIDDARLGKWAAGVAAETNSLAARISLDTVLTHENTVVLLASDTDEGVAAAMIAAARIAADATGAIDYERVRYVSSPILQVVGRGGEAGWSHRFAPHTVTVVRVRELDPRQPGGLDLAAAGLGQALRAAYDSAAGSPVEIHLTGGLKATLLHTLLMAEVLYSLDERTEVSAWYLYEDTTADPTPVRIGLRRFDPAEIRNMREELCHVRDRKITSRRTFEGMAWRLNDGGGKLTDFGTAYLAVLGTDDGFDDQGYRG